MGNPVSSLTQRTYAGFTKRQSLIISEALRPPRGPAEDLRIIDPMGGQGASLISEVARSPQLELTLVDINPAALYYARARVLARHPQRDRLVEAALDRMSRTKLISARRQGSPFVEAWLSEETALALRSWDTTTTSLNLFPAELDPVSTGSILLVLTARRLATFRASKNPAHWKRGGLSRQESILDAVRSHGLPNLNALDANGPSVDLSERVRLEVGNSTASAADSFRTFDWLFTSPPYGNSLDYSRLWAPELAVVDALHSATFMPAVGGGQIGSVSVRGRPPADVTSLGASARAALISIRDDGGRDSAGYYYSKFSNYLVELRLVTLSSLALLRPGARAFIFIRDTVRKDVVVPAADVVVESGIEAGFKIRAKELVVVRGHIGLRQKGKIAALTGQAQREWVIEMEAPGE